MNSQVWLAGVVGVAGLVLIGLVLVVLRAVSPGRRSPSRSAAGSDAPPPKSVAIAARGLGHMFGAYSSPRRPRSVEENLRRAFDRIDSVDPYAGPGRIGAALSEVGLLDSGPAGTGDGPSRHTWPTTDRRRDLERGEDQQ